MRNTGFTLAEVLITLGVIGIVAALTIPAIITNIQDKQFKTAYKESISIISQAMRQIYADSEETYTSTEWQQMPVYFCKLQKQMKVSKSGINCELVNDDSVFTSNSAWPKTSTKWHAGNTWYDKKHNPQGLNYGYMHLTIDLMNGMRINFNCNDAIFVDVNGDKKPNTIGRDIYFMYFEDGQTSPNTGFSKRTSIRPNVCSTGGTNATPTLTKDNYVEDCLQGSGWGCSFML